MTAALAPARHRQLTRPAGAGAFRPAAGRAATPHRHPGSASNTSALPHLREFLIAATLVAIAVLSMQLVAPRAEAVPATNVVRGELVVTVQEGETLDDVLERIADGPARIDLGEQIVRLNGGNQLQAGRQFVVRVS